jgi:hypothetical protein
VFCPNSAQFTQNKTTHNLGTIVFVIVFKGWSFFSSFRGVACFVIKTAHCS